MIDEIYELHKTLDDDHCLKLKMVRYDYETEIEKEDKLEKVNTWILKVIRPSGSVCLVNVEFVMMAFVSKKMEWY